MKEGRVHRRGALAATIAATLLIPAVGSIAGPKEQLRKNEKQLSDVRRSIENLSGSEQSLRRQVNRLNSALTRLQVQLVKLDEEIEVVDTELADAQAKIDATQAEIDRVEDIATEQAVQLYMDGGTDTIDALLDSASLGELDEKVELMGVASQNNTSALVKYGRLRNEIEAQNIVMLEKRAELRSRQKDRLALEHAMITKKTALDANLGALREKLGIAQSKETHLENEQASIQERIIEHEAKNAVAVLGTSNEGFIWPVNGSVTSYYGPRWGRMHTGWDIDAVSGQPIVSAKEGRIVLAEYYSGYGNAVSIDHGGGYSTLYAHMSSFSTSNGAYVEQGEIIGYVGCTGSCTGDHLHFEVRVNGEPVDPAPYMP